MWCALFSLALAFLRPHFISALHFGWRFQNIWTMHAIEIVHLFSDSLSLARSVQMMIILALIISFEFYGSTVANFRKPLIIITLCTECSYKMGERETCTPLYVCNVYELNSGHRLYVSNNKNNEIPPRKFPEVFAATNAKHIKRIFVWMLERRASSAWERFPNLKYIHAKSTDWITK